MNCYYFLSEFFQIRIIEIEKVVSMMEFHLDQPSMYELFPGG